MSAPTVPAVKTLQRPAHARAVCFDSDGCVFDVMTVKHEQAFGPAFVDVFGLDAVRDAAMEVWRFVNLYSRSRGANRFVALRRALDLLPTHPAVAGHATPQFSGLTAWLNSNPKLGEPALAQAAADDADLQQVLQWTREVNRRVKELSEDDALFPGAGPAVTQTADHADIYIISNAPQATLEHEWRRAGLLEHVTALAGQEAGGKVEQIIAACGDRYPRSQVLMVGDAPGDQEAADTVGCRFYAILPGAEAASWQRYREDILPAFRAGGYDSRAQARETQRFAAALPSDPGWA